MRWEPVRIWLPPKGVTYADNVACYKQADGFFNRRKQGNNLVADFDKSFSHNRLGYRAEASGQIYLHPISWNWRTTHGNGPDLGEITNVKGRYRDTDDLIVQKNASENLAYLFISGEHHPEYWVWGWAWGYEAKQDKYWDDKAKNGRPAYFMPREDMPHPPEELRAIVHDNNEAVIEEMMQFAREVLN